ncbi:MAG TPA: di-heme oxidoredictase family protein [Polyangiaceae bacterium]|nr:di-heme oxidoredictase family protein [Polyangiaceae bacterium]
MVVKTQRGLSRSAVIFTGASLLLSALYAAACSSAGSGPNGGGQNNNTAGASANMGGASALVGGAANASGNNPGGGSDPGSAGAGNTTGNPNPPAMCIPKGEMAPTLPASFTGRCGVCHSAFGASANPKVPNLFDTKDTLEQFKMQVRMGKDLMPPFDANAISDADIEQTYNYFKAGKPGELVTCTDANGGKVGTDLCGGGVSFTPLFVQDPTDTREPIVKKDANGHFIFRGAGRVRFRHEMEPEYATYHGHYWENRTFSYVLDDSIAAGGDTITVTFTPSSNQYYSAQGVNQEGGADLNIRFWKLYGHPDGNAYAGNVGGASKDVLPMECSDPKTSCNTKKYQYVIKYNQRENRKIQVGDQFQIEFGIFMARYAIDGEKGPPFDGGHVRNIIPLPNGCTLNGPPYNNACYTQANYYSDSFRYVAGKGTLTPYNEDCTMSVPPDSGISGSGDCGPNGTIGQAVKAGTLKERMGPTEAGWSGGLVTMPYLRQRFDMYYSQMSPNILGENSENFVGGRRLFHMQYTTGEHSETDNKVPAEEMKPYVGIAGPSYNQVNCEGCHVKNNRGFPPKGTEGFESLVLKLAAKEKDPTTGGSLPDPHYGLQLQDKGSTAEGKATYTWTSVPGQFGDGTPYMLRKPTVAFSGLKDGDPVSYSLRLARPIIGLGLLEAIPEADIIAKSDPADCNKDGISGVANIVYDPEDKAKHVGRFGWKASKASLKHQASEALMLDIGVTSSIFPKIDCGPMQAGCDAGNTATPEFSDADLNKLVTYVRTLAVPPRRDIDDPTVLHGQELFATAGCVNCHAPNAHTGADHPFLELRDQVIHPYSDLLLHDMGDDLKDSGAGDFLATASEWRTPPLWGIGLCDDVAKGWQKDGEQNNPSPDMGPCRYLHDGRAEQLIDAVLWHGGEAKGARDKVVAMPKADRDALVAFLKSL